MEVNKGGVEKHWASIVNPPHFLVASILKSLVISDRLKKKSVVLTQV